MGYPQKGLIDGSIKKENYLLLQEDRSVTLPFFARNRGYTIDGGSDLYQWREKGLILSSTSKR